MADVHRLPDERRVFQEASAWVARLQADDVTAEDRASFKAWREEHPLHGRTFDDLARTWNRFAAARSVVRAVAFGQSMSEAASKVEGRGVVSRNQLRYAAWAAAAAVIAIGLGWLAYLRGSPESIYATAMGEHATVSLPDGSTLELDSDSRARVDFSKRYRVVHLDRGEAFFTVTHDVQRPFWVVGGGSWVRDVGTAFNVDLHGTGLRVTVSQGTVGLGAINPLLQHIQIDALLSGAPALSLLTAGHQADLQGTAVAIRSLTPAELLHAISWRSGILYFENQPLSDVTQELRRYTPLHIVIPDEHLRQLPIAGTFDTNPQGVETFLTMLEQGLDLSVRRDGERVIIAPAQTTVH